MGVHFHVLASGSSGNACVLEVDGFGLLLDFGLPLKQLDARMKRARLTWDRIHAAILTHTHTDHWQASTLAQLAKLKLPVYCHEGHVSALNPDSRAHATLSAANLLRPYDPGQRLALHADCTCLPMEISHDGGATCGFRLEGKTWAVGYATDLGCWTPELANQFADVDLLAIEFNHDVTMQMQSGRHPQLIRRVLGDQGHLSNNQAADLFASILRCSVAGSVKQLVQLHLSQDCNRPELAEAAASRVLQNLNIDMPIYTITQGKVSPRIRVDELVPPTPRRRTPAFMQPVLPFADWPILTQQ